MIESRLLSKEEIISIIEGYNNQSTIVKIPKLELSQATYDSIALVNALPLALIAEEVVINDEIMEDAILATYDTDDNAEENNLNYSQVGKRNIYTKKKYVYKKKNKGSRKNRKMRSK